jgi:methionine-rich copper-binding protein CopC
VAGAIDALGPGGVKAIRSAIRTAAILAAVGVAVAVLPAPASAHSVLLGTSPADGAAVTTMTSEVTLTFNEPVMGRFSTVAVTGPDGVAYGDGALQVIDNIVHQPVFPLRSGNYQVAWRVVSADGHPVSGTFAFTVTLPADLEPTITPVAAASASAPESGWSMWWWAGLAALAVLPLLLIRFGRRRRQS